MREKDLLDEEDYKQARADEFVWQRAKALGISRRKFIRLMTFGTGITVASLSGISSRSALAEQTVYKPTPKELFYDYGTDKEMRWSAMYDRGYLVPNELFYVRNHSRSLRINPASWRLRVEGTGVAKPKEFTYDELLQLPSISVIRMLECAGNGRSFYQTVQGKKAAGTQWKLGGVGVAEWTGVPLREVLSRVGLKPTATDVMPIGLDDQKKARRPMPIAKALAEDTLLVYAMNGQVLPPDHGFPMRILVPGWLGAASIKWVGRIEVSEQPLYAPWNTESYVLIGADYKASPPAKGEVITSQNIKSAFELGASEQISAGQHLIRGRSWSSGGKITKVEVSMDAGKNWLSARLREPNLAGAWVRWDIDWNASKGNYDLQARATDEQGNTQAMSVPFNEKGYMYNAVVSHPVRVV